MLSAWIDDDDYGGGGGGGGGENDIGKYEKNINNLLRGWVHL